MSRERMPWCARVIDGLREVFGRPDMNEVIRRGLRPDCEPRERVYLQEGGEVLGIRFVPPAEKMVSAAQMVIGPVVTAVKRGRQ